MGATSDEPTSTEITMRLNNAEKDKNQGTDLFNSNKGENRRILEDDIVYHVVNSRNPNNPRANPPTTTPNADGGSFNDENVDPSGQGIFNMAFMSNDPTVKKVVKEFHFLDNK